MSGISRNYVVSSTLTPGGYDPEFVYLRDIENGVPLPWFSPKANAFRSFNYKPEDFVDFDDYTRELLQDYGSLQATLQTQGTGEVQSTLSGHEWAKYHTYPALRHSYKSKPRGKKGTKRKGAGMNNVDEISSRRRQKQKYRFGNGWGAGSFNFHSTGK